MVVVLMGVSGCGKTTVGRALAGRLGWPFHDGDDHHPPANVEKMRRGIPLTEDDRSPWLATLRGTIDAWLDGSADAVLACSALTRRSRARLGTARPGVSLVHLQGTAELIRGRLQRRAGHYFPSGLLQSQFDVLEPPENALTVDIEQSPELIVAAIRQRLAI